MEKNSIFFFNTDKIEIKDENNESYVFGYISTKDKDLVNDIVTDNCLKSMFHQMKDRTIKFDVEHESFRGATDTEKELNKTLNPIAKVDWFGLDANGLMVKAILNRHHPRFNEVKGSLDDGFLDGFSIAYIPTKSNMEDFNGESIRKLEDLRLLNVAFTGNAINEQARITEVMAKSLDYLDKARKVGGFESPEPGDLPEKGKKILAETYASARKRGMSKERASKIAWGAVRRAGFKSYVPEKDTKNSEVKSMEEEDEKKPESEKVEVKSAIEDLKKTLTVSLKSIEDRVSALEKKGEEGEEGGEPEKPEKEPEKPPEKENPVESEVKSLKERVDKIEKTPLYKSVQGDMKKELAGEIKEVLPLDAI